VAREKIKKTLSRDVDNEYPFLPEELQPYDLPRKAIIDAKNPTEILSENRENFGVYDPRDFKKMVKRSGFTKKELLKRFRKPSRLALDKEFRRKESIQKMLNESNRSPSIDLMKAYSEEQLRGHDDKLMHRHGQKFERGFLEIPKGALSTDEFIKRMREDRPSMFMRPSPSMKVLKPVEAPLRKKLLKEYLEKKKSKGV
tara:strand:- start:49 stop:645 length:597 start_codon:yes stop_codon:yes gene_type:complete